MAEEKSKQHNYESPFEHMYFSGVAFVLIKEGKRSLHIVRNEEEAEHHKIPGFPSEGYADWFGAGTCLMDMGRLFKTDCTFWSDCAGSKACRMQQSKFDPRTKKWGPWVPHFFNPDYDALDDPNQAWKCSCV